MRIVNAIKNVIGKIDLILFSICSISLVTLAFVAVVFRFIINHPIMWAEEVEMILIVWSVFFGASVAFREHGHLAVDLLYERFPKIAKRGTDIIIWVFSLFCIVALTIIEFGRVRTLAGAKLTTPLLKIPTKYEFIVVVFACVLMILDLLINAIEYIYKLKKDATV